LALLAKNVKKDGGVGASIFSAETCDGVSPE
jgi:hypothetical protein